MKHTVKTISKKLNKAPEEVINILKDFGIDNMNPDSVISQKEIGLLTRPDVVVNFSRCFYEYHKPVDALFIGSYPHRKLLDEKKGTGKTSMSMKELALLTVSSKNNFMVKNKGDYKILDTVETKNQFDFVFSDDISPWFQSTRKRDCSDSKQVDFNGEMYYATQGYVDVIGLIEYLKDDGILIVEIEEKGLFSAQMLAKDKKTRVTISMYDLLKNKGFYINAILGVPARIAIGRKRARKDSTPKPLVVISKRHTENMLVAELQQYANHLNLIKKIHGKDLKTAKELKDGYFIKYSEFTSYRELAERDRINILKTDYKGFNEYCLNDLIIKIFEDTPNANNPGSETIDSLIERTIKNIKKNISDIKTHKNNLLIAHREFDWIVKMPKNLHSREFGGFHVVFNDKVISEYLSIFLESSLGRSLYRSRLTPDSANRSYELTKESLKKITVYVPSIDIQKQIIRSHNKVLKLQDSINTFSNNLSLNPAQFISEAINQVDDMLDQVGKLNDADRIRAMIRGIIEDGKSEFKQTWQLPTGGEKKEQWEETKNLISATVFKVINSYLNANGGTLVIGVVDSTHEITGLGPELEHYFKKDNTIEKRIDRFENKFHKSLNKAFSKEFVDLVSYRPVLIEDKYVWMIVCESAQRPCVVIDPKVVKILNGQEFYVREGGNSVPYSGQDRMNYIDMHFYNS